VETIRKKIDELLTQKDMVVVAIDGKCTSGTCHSLMGHWIKSLDLSSNICSL
jgi:hypothetical protein